MSKRESLTESMRRLSDIVTEAEQIDEIGGAIARGLKTLVQRLKRLSRKGRTEQAAELFLKEIYSPVLTKALAQFDHVLDLGSVQLKQESSPQNQLLRGVDYTFVIDAKPEALTDVPYMGDRTHKGLIDQSITGEIQRTLNKAQKQWESTSEGKQLRNFVTNPRVDFSYAGNGKYQTFNIKFTMGEWDFNI